MFQTRINPHILPLLGVGVVLMATGACSSGGSDSNPAPADLPRAVAEAYNKNTPVDAKVVQTNSTFGFNLFSELQKSDGKKNLFLSPTSISLALQIVFNGAGGDTKTGMDKALSLNGASSADLNARNAALQASLVSSTPDVTLTIANGLWFKSSAVKPDFVKLNTDYYGSELGSTAGLPKTVNDWVSSKTNGKIPTILPDQDYSDTVAVLVNAIYFKGAWTHKFDAGKTKDSPFTLLDDTTSTVKMMQQQVETGYLQGANFQAVRLPYGKDGRLSLYVFLPSAGTAFGDFLKTLTPENWTSWMPKFGTALVTLKLPRFKSSYSVALKDPLSTLGMGTAFDATGKADLNGIADGAYIQFVQHKTFVEVNEEGTEAAGATGIGIGVTSVPTPATMTVDHPFFCAIRDDKTGTILFMGTIVNPNQ